MDKHNYRITEQLHIGTTYISYRAVREPDGLRVILKTPRASYPTPQALNRLRHEFSILQRLTHDNIVKALALEPFENALAIVCEEAAGNVLSACTNGKPLDLSLFFAVALPLTQAVQSHHRHRIIHKNISPSNVLFDPVTHRLTLCGFSLATELAREVQQPTAREAVEVDLAYIAPEQTGRMNRALDHRTDLYSLGSLFYELLTGQPPFVADTPLELVHSHLARPPEPPHERRPGLPRVLSQIVLRLLTKSPEDRYQSATGLLHDLQRCSDCHQTPSGVVEFAIGEKDVSDQFQIPEKLYGRTQEMNRLVDAFCQTGTSRTGVVFIGGYSGVGKTGLVREVQKTIDQTNGFFISGKFDQYKRDVPMSSLLAAFRELVRQLLTGTDEQIARWRRNVLDAVGPIGQVIIDVIPDLALFIGPQPAVPELPPVEANNRFNQLFDRFVNVFVRAEHPLCIFLDDLQWIDSTTRQWIETRLTTQSAGHLLFIGAYRDNEVSASHPLTLMMDRLNQSGVAVDHIRLQPLDQATLGWMIADTLATPPDRCADLTEVIFKKTGGNPFFCRQCLLSLYEDGAIYFVPEQQVWAYDLDRVQQAKISDNVVDLMTGLIRRLPAKVQNLLTTAACIGNRFSLSTLSLVSQQSPDDTHTQLAVALHQGLFVPLRSWNREDMDEFAFLHDRVQQAALSLLPQLEKQTTRLRIGRLMLQESVQGETEDRVYDIADHLNSAGHLIDNADERQQVARINLAASIRAKNSSAYEPALRYVRQAMELLPAASWDQPSVLTCELLLQRAESEHLCGNDQPAEGYFDQAVLHATATLDKAKIYQRKIHYYINLGKFEQAYRTGREAVYPLGVRLPAKFFPPMFVKDLITYRFLLGRRNVADLINLKVMTDERLKMAVLLIATFAKAAYQLNPRLCVAVCLRMVNICLRHGNTDGVSTGFLALGPIFLGAIMNRKQMGFDIGQLTLALAEKFRRFANKAEIHFVVGYFAIPWRRPAVEMERHWQIAYEAGLETGDLFHASCACCGTIQSYYMRGMNFDEILNTADRYLEFLHRINNQEAILTLQAVRQSIGNLRGQTASPTAYTDDTFDEERYVAELSRFGSRHFAHYYFINKMQTLYLWGEYEQAYELSIQSDRYLNDSPGMLHTAEHYFYKGLIICSLYEESTGFRRLKWRVALRRIGAAFRSYAEGSPSNFSHKSQLLGAEICRINNDPAGAERLYYAAVDSARQYEYVHIYALANELLARFQSQAGRRRVAGFHLRDAEYAYRQLGATACAAGLSARYPTLFDYIDEPDTLTGETTKAGNVLPPKAGVSSLDLATVLKSSEAISREIRLPDLLSALMRIIIENAGGQRMVFLLQRGNELVVQAECLAVSSQVQLFDEIPLNDYATVARSVINYVARTQETVILDDAAASGNFTNDAYIQDHKPRSVLCAPLIQQGHLIGIIYLENNLTDAAFTQDRIDVLILLSGQMAISIENALLYRNLEEKVKERTAELHQSLEHLRTTQTQLIQKEKMASLGELTAGIAHEIQNPLNFVNNFSEVSVELVDELIGEYQKPIRETDLETELLTDLKANLQKITHHGGRASGIVKAMLEHVHTSSGERGSTDLNALTNNCLQVTYQGLRSKDHTVDIQLITDFDPSAGRVEVVPQDIDRVLLNLFQNAFYAVREKQKTAGPDYQPTVTVSTKRGESQISIQVQDNGTGIPDLVKQKIFQPFFTTKPAGQGTGLGLSLSYDIVTKGHGGQLTVSSREAEGTVITVELPT